MISFLTYLLFFLIPILLILIVRLKKRQRIVYDHTFLTSFQDNSLRDFLLRSFQLYFDVLFDLLLAVILALLLSRVVMFSTKRTAVCIDGSYSMIRGGEEPPLERALSLVFEDRLPEKKYRLFLLAFNPSRGRNELFSLRGIKDFGSPGKARENLVKTHSFFSVDMKQLEDLFRKGYSRVIFITDRFPQVDTNLEIMEVGVGQDGFFYPVSAHYDFSSEAFMIHLYRQNYEGEIGVEKFNEKENAYRSYSYAEETFQKGDHSIIKLKEEGLYRIFGPDIDFIFPVEKPVFMATVNGDYSRIIVDVLPHLEEGGKELLLADLPYAQEDSRKVKKKINALGNYRRKIITLLPAGETSSEPYIYPLERTFSQPSYAEFPPELFSLKLNQGAIFFQNPKMIRDGQTPMVYLSYLDKGPGSPFESISGLKASKIHSGITSYVFTSGGRTVALNLPPEEFFPLPPEKDLVFTKRRLQPLPYFLLLLFIYLGKIAFLYRYNAGRR